ncbi:ATP-binding protein [Seohaeicola zhoushanensis]
MRTFTPQAAAKRLELTCQVDETLPEFMSDPNRLEQVLRNFLSNAIKFTDSGSVDLAVRRDGNDIVFAVKDSGIGIKPEEQDVIFEAFRQADGTISRKFGGTGLGLSISRQLAEMLGGDIDVESAPGQGSTFSIRLPMRSIEETGRARAPAQPRRSQKPVPRESEPAESETGIRFPHRLPVWRTTGIGCPRVIASYWRSRTIRPLPGYSSTSPMNSGSAASSPVRPRRAWLQPGISCRRR